MRRKLIPEEIIEQKTSRDGMLQIQITGSSFSESKNEMLVKSGYFISSYGSLDSAGVM
jgi:hypothetical protein